MSGDNMAEYYDEECEPHHWLGFDPANPALAGTAIMNCTFDGIKPTKYYELVAPTATEADRREYKTRELAKIYGDGVYNNFKVPERLYNVPPGTYTVEADEVYENEYDNELQRANALEAQAARLLVKAQEMREERERFGEDDFPEGAVITFEKMFPGGTKLYSYAAIKVIHRSGDHLYTGGMHQGDDVELWYTTGPKSPKGYTWEELVKWMGKGVKEVFYVSELKRFV